MTDEQAELPNEDTVSDLRGFRMKKIITIVAVMAVVSSVAVTGGAASAVGLQHGGGALHSIDGLCGRCH